MRLEYFVLEPVLIDHDFEVNIDVLTPFKVDSLFLLLLFFHLFHLLTSLFTLLLQLLNFVKGVCGLGWVEIGVAWFHKNHFIYDLNTTS
jgi:hypothetical protein